MIAEKYNVKSGNGLKRSTYQKLVLMNKSKCISIMYFITRHRRQNLYVLGIRMQYVIDKFSIIMSIMSITLYTFL